MVAVDEGEESNHALSWCLQNVAAAGDTLVLLYAQPPRVVYSAMDGTGKIPLHLSPFLRFSPMNLPPTFRPDFLISAGYLFSSDIIATMDKYSKEVADSVIQRATRTCGDSQKVSESLCQN